MSLGVARIRREGGAPACFLLWREVKWRGVSRPETSNCEMCKMAGVEGGARMWNSINRLTLESRDRLLHYSSCLLLRQVCSYCG